MAISDVSSYPAPGDTSLFLEEQYPNIEELILILRCCLTLLTWLGFDQTLTIENAKFLLSILGRLISFDINRKNGDHSIKLMLRRECTYAEDGVTASVIEDFASLCFVETPCPYRSSLCALLEVISNFRRPYGDVINHLMPLIAYFNFINSTMFSFSCYF